MDTLFRLVRLQYNSDDHGRHKPHSTTNSTSSSRANSSAAAYQQQQEEQEQEQEEEQEDQECGFINNTHHLIHQTLPYCSSSSYYSGFNMDPDDHFSAASSSSSSKHYLRSFNPGPPPPSQHQLSAPLPPNYPPEYLFFSDPNRRWAADLLLDCARAVASRDSPRVQHLMWMLNELASPYGDLVDHKLASYFLQALFARLTSSGPRTLRALSSASDRAASFDSTRRTALRFQELSPWSSFGHVAANGAILESLLLRSPSPPRLHILDFSTTFCTQWPTLLEALATRSSADDTPHVSITAIVPSASPAARRVMREISARMDRFGRLMAVPFRFSVVHHPDSDLSSLDLDSIIAEESSALVAVNCINSLHGVPPSARRREALLAKIRRLRPGIVTVVEEDAELDFASDDDDNEEGFLKVFREGLRFFSAYFDSLEECFPKTSNERLALERAAGRAVVDLVACPAGDSAERRETAVGWSKRMKNAGFSHLAFSDDVSDDLRALLKRYKDGMWSMRAAVSSEEAEESSSSVDGGGRAAGAGIFLTWKEEAVVWASAWKLA
ncbi:Protein SHORT-ROOT 1 [Platanthera guangdongensis]|uniref:Protein SHORT-ROOT 1 n=1 Tax=Platanthera guangdongensis TaxID=2320717 RepID=A0ABR2M308_9ASPA